MRNWLVVLFASQTVLWGCASGRVAGVPPLRVPLVQQKTGLTPPEKTQVPRTPARATAVAAIAREAAQMRSNIPPELAKNKNNITGIAQILSLDTSVRALLADVELLADRGLGGVEATELLSDAGGRLISDGGARFSLLSSRDENDEKDESERARESWRGLSEIERERAKNLHRAREDRVKETLETGLAARLSAFQRKTPPTESSVLNGARIIESRFLVPGGEVLTTQEIDPYGILFKLSQSLQGTVDGVAIEAKRVRHFLSDGSVRLSSESRLGTGNEVQTIAWQQVITPAGELTGSGTISTPDGVQTAVRATGNITDQERVETTIEGVAVEVVSQRGQNTAELVIRSPEGKETRGAFGTAFQNQMPDEESSKRDAAPGNANGGSGQNDKDEDDDDKDRPSQGNANGGPGQNDKDEDDDDKDRPSQGNANGGPGQNDKDEDDDDKDRPSQGNANGGPGQNDKDEDDDDKDRPSQGNSNGNSRKNDDKKNGD